MNWLLFVISFTLTEGGYARDADTKMTLFNEYKTKTSCEIVRDQLMENFTTGEIAVCIEDKDE